MQCVRKPFVFATTLAVLTVLAAGPARADWPQFLGPNRTSQLPQATLDISPQAKLPELWSTEIGIGYSSLVVADGKLYTMGNDGLKDVIYCFDAVKGTKIWTYSYPSPINMGGYYGPRSTPAVDETGVYALSGKGLLHCLDPKDGTLKWKMDLAKMKLKAPRWGVAGSPLLDGDKIILDMGPIIALNKSNGQLAWRSRPKPASYSSPIKMTIKGQDLVATFDGSGLTVVKPGSGQEAFSFAWKTPYGVHSCSPIAVGNDRVLITSGYGTGATLLDLSGSSARQVWKTKDLAAQCNMPVVIDGYLYGFDGNVGGGGKLKCVSLADGKEQWSQKGLGTGSLVAVGKTLVILGEKGDLAIAKADPASFQKISQRKILEGGDCWTPPIIVGNKLYARNYIKSSKVSKLVCIDLSK